MQRSNRSVLQRWLFVAVALTVWGTTLHAEALPFSFGEVRFIETELDDTNLEGDGFAVKLSGEFSQRFFGLAEFTRLDFDGGAELDSREFGVGYGRELNVNTDLFGTVSRVKTEGDSGWGLGFGIRTLVIRQRLELAARVHYVNLDDSETGISLAVLINMTRRWSLGFQADIGDEATGVSFALRYYFNQ